MEKSFNKSRCNKIISRLRLLFSHNNNGLHKSKTLLIVALILMIAAGLGVFPSGQFSNSYQMENACNYLADIAENHTTNGIYTSLVVEPKNEQHKLLDPSVETYSTYGTFRENNANFAGTVNATKEHKILFPEIGKESNYSFLYVEMPGFSNIEYKGAWKHSYYPLQLMFHGVHKNTGTFSFFYISESDARALLTERKLPHTKENFERLIGSTTTLIFDDQRLEWTIANIYLETNYFYEALKETMGDFFLGSRVYPEGFKKQSSYFLRNYSFQNRFYLNYCRGNYPLENYEYTINDFNIDDDFVVDQSVLNFLKESSSNGVSISLIAILIIIYSIGFFLFIFFIKTNKPSFLQLILFDFSLFIPFIIFSIVYSFTKNLAIFSHFSCVIYSILTFVTIFSGFIILICKCYGKKDNKT